MARCGPGSVPRWSRCSAAAQSGCSQAATLFLRASTRRRWAAPSYCDRLRRSRCTASRSAAACARRATDRAPSSSITSATSIATADASDGIEGGGGGVRTQPDEIAGELDVIDPLPAWAGGLDIRAARGPEWRELLRRAAGREDRLRQIQVARGYHPGWIWHALSKHKPEVRA